MLGDPSNVSVALFGDSHGNALTTSIGKYAARNGFGVKQFTIGGCPPVENVKSDYTGLGCVKHNEDAYAYVLKDKSIHSVIIVARWTRWYEGIGFNNGIGGVDNKIMRVDAMRDGKPTRLREEERKGLLKERYLESIKKLLAHGKSVYLIYPIPEVGWDVPSYLAQQSRLGKSRYEGDLTTPITAFQSRNRGAYEIFDSLGEISGLVRLYPADALCDAARGVCMAQKDGLPLYVDDNHLSFVGADLVVSKIFANINL